MIYITYSNENHGISGHIYEVIDYFWYLKDFFDIKILITDFYDVELYRKTITYRYSFSESEIDYIFKNTIFRRFSNNRIERFECDILISTNGFLGYGRYFYVRNFIGFRCTKEKPFDLIISPNKLMLQDNRIYDNTPKGFRSIHYVKKIYYDIIKKPKREENNYLLYINSTYRNIDISKYVKKYRNLYIVSPTHHTPPVDNLFEKFHTYIYTPITRKFDCSSRLVKECQYFGKKIIFDIDYYDKALDVRTSDCIAKTDLKHDKQIVEIIREVI